MNIRPIDVWDVETFDEALLAHLRDAAKLIRGYLETDWRQFLEREASDHRGAYPVNPYGRQYYAFTESLIPCMAKRAIRAWHYTRLTDDEAQSLRQEGPIISDMDGIRRRLAAQVSAGRFTSDVAERLWKDSPFHQQEDIRSGRFWMTSGPISPSSGLVDLLLGHWGGEGIYFWQEDPSLVALLQGIGTARIVELRAPLDSPNDCYKAAGTIVSTFARSIGCRGEKDGFDFCVERPLGPGAVLAIHSAGDAEFEAMARGYPERFVGGLEE